MSDRTPSGLRRRAAVIGLTLLPAVPIGAAGRQVDTAACLVVSTAELCRASAELAAVITVRGAAVATAGNPVPGTASTLGKRMPGMPRLAFTVRRNAGSSDLPAAAGVGSSAGVTAWSGEVTVGLLDGFSPFPTVGGLLSLDVLGSASIVQFSSADGFRTRAPSSYALGARLGVFRESFNLPGLSLSALYRRTGRVSFGDIGLQTRDLHVRVDRVGTWSTRAVAGKRIAGVGITAGGGWDRHSGHGVFRVADALGRPVPFEFRDLDADRRILFAGVSWTRLVFNISGEVGWQFEAGDEGDVAGDGGLFGGLAFRTTF